MTSEGKLPEVYLLNDNFRAENEKSNIYEV